MAAQIPCHPTRTRRRSPTATVPNPNPPTAAAPAPARERHGHTREQGEGWPRGCVDLRRTAARERGRRQSWRLHHRRRMGGGSQRIRGGGSRQIRGGSSRRGRRRRIHASGGGDGEAGLEEADPRLGEDAVATDEAHPRRSCSASTHRPCSSSRADLRGRVGAGGGAARRGEPWRRREEGTEAGLAPMAESERGRRRSARARGGDGGVRE
jgi:hypothetical protein